jgi:hypothetical protein
MIPGWDPRPLASAVLADRDAPDLLVLAAVACKQGRPQLLVELAYKASEPIPNGGVPS